MSFPRMKSVLEINASPSALHCYFEPYLINGFRGLDNFKTEAKETGDNGKWFLGRMIDIS